VAHWTSEIVDYLATLGLGTVGTNLFFGQLPATPDECGAVIPAPGSPAEMKFGSQGVYLENPRAQIVFRGTMDDVNTALLKAQTAFEALAQSNVTLGSTLFYRIAPMQSPYLRGYSAHGGPEVAFMIEAQKEVF
jgi:hypothetical protein